MISIKKFLEQRLNSNADADVLEASLQTSQLLLDAIATHVVRGREADRKKFEHVLKSQLRTMEQKPSAMRLLEIASETVDALEIYARRTSEYIHEQKQQMQSMISMLTETLAAVSGQADLSVARLHAIEQQIERASELDDMRALNTSLQSCLTSLREAAAQQRKGSEATVQRLRDQIEIAQKKIVPETSPSRPGFEDIELEPERFSEVPESSSTPYVAAFKLQRANHIATRFGEQTKQNMLALLSQSLKTVLGPNDRLLRWKGTSFVMFLESHSTIQEVRTLLSEAVAATGQHYIEVGKKSALLSVGVDWIVFPQSQHPSLDAVFNEIDSFLAGKVPVNSFHAEEKA